MNRDRNSWVPRKHGADGDERATQPPRPRPGGIRHDGGIAFFTEPPSPTPQGGQAVAGVVKWFNEQKGYGFVELAGGQGDAFLHINVLQSSGRQIAPAGAKVLVTVNAGDRGPQVASVLEIDASATAERDRSVRPSASDRRAARGDPILRQLFL